MGVSLVCNYFGAGSKFRNSSLRILGLAPKEKKVIHSNILSLLLW